MGEESGGIGLGATSKMEKDLNITRVMCAMYKISTSVIFWCMFM